MPLSLSMIVHKVLQSYHFKNLQMRICTPQKSPSGSLLVLDSDNISAFSSVSGENGKGNPTESSYPLCSMFPSKVHITHIFLNLDFPNTGLSGNITTCEIMCVMSLIHYKHSLKVSLLLSFLLPKNKKKYRNQG